mmetsp:Transcript_113403/g.326054  ORF Transcript_113403/g.326054 Transcript_113403/m.326054 type:complete len:272 (+) Transcript_113403:462-1277(+)
MSFSAACMSRPTTKAELKTTPSQIKQTCMALRGSKWSSRLSTWGASVCRSERGTKSFCSTSAAQELSEFATLATMNLLKVCKSVSACFPGAAAVTSICHCIELERRSFNLRWADRRSLVSWAIREAVMSLLPGSKMLGFVRSQRSDIFTSSKLIPCFDRLTASGARRSYSSMNASEGQEKPGKITVSTFTLLLKAVHTSPTHHGRKRKSCEQQTTSVSVSELTTPKRSARSRKLSESTKTCLPTCCLSRRDIFRSRAKLPAPALWWEMKNW